MIDPTTLRWEAYNSFGLQAGFNDADEIVLYRTQTAKVAVYVYYYDAEMVEELISSDLPVFDEINDLYQAIRANQININDEYKGNGFRQYVTQEDINNAEGEEEPPTIVSLSPNQNIEEGGEIFISVTAGGTLPLSYQWHKNGNAISGATNSSFVIPISTFTDSGKYSVSISNSFGSITSEKIIVIVSTMVITSLSDIPNLEYDFDFATAVNSSGKITSITDSVNGTISSQSSPSLQPIYSPDGGINNIPHGVFNSGMKLIGDVLMPSADNVTFFVIRKMLSAPTGFNGFFGNGDGNGYGLIDNSNDNRKAGLLPNQTTYDSLENSLVTGLWTIEVGTSSRVTNSRNFKYNVFGVKNSSAIPSNTFATPTGFHTIGNQPTTNNSENAIQRVFGYSRVLNDGEIRSVSEYISQTYNLPLPTIVITEGDSITASGTYPNYIWSELLSESLNYYVYNNAVSGSKTSDIINLRLTDLVERYDARVENIITLMIGHNDLAANVPVNTIWDNINTICNDLRDAGYKIILQTVLISNIETGSPSKMTELTDLNNRIRTMGTGIADVIVDSYNIPELLDPSNTTYYVDGVHPTNPTGSNLIGDLLLPQIKDLID